MKRFIGVLVAGGVLVVAVPAAAQSTIRLGDNVRGSLSSSDPSLADGSHYDCFNLQARAGDRISVTLTSDDFDAYLAVMEGRNCSSDETAETDDDSAGETNSLVRTTLGSGPYSIRANSLGGGETGDYRLSVSAAPPLPPIEVAYLGRSSTQVVGELIDGDALADDESWFDCYAFDVRAGQAVGIALTSPDFDAFLSLHEGATCDAQIEADDDSLGEGTDAYIERVIDRDGRYSVRANSLSARQTGNYGLVLEIR
jgi:hypothetical protein